LAGRKADTVVLARKERKKKKTKMSIYIIIHTILDKLYKFIINLPVIMNAKLLTLTGLMGMCGMMLLVTVLVGGIVVFVVKNKKDTKKKDQGKGGSNPPNTNPSPSNNSPSNKSSPTTPNNPDMKPVDPMDPEYVKPEVTFKPLKDKVPINPASCEYEPVEKQKQSLCDEPCGSAGKRFFFVEPKAGQPSTCSPLTIKTEACNRFPCYYFTGWDTSKCYYADKSIKKAKYVAKDTYNKAEFEAAVANKQKPASGSPPSDETCSAEDVLQNPLVAELKKKYADLPSTASVMTRSNFDKNTPCKDREHLLPQGYEQNDKCTYPKGIESQIFSGYGPIDTQYVCHGICPKMSEEEYLNLKLPK
jgi:hypothetical protein